MLINELANDDDVEEFRLKIKEKYMAHIMTFCRIKQDVTQSLTAVRANRD